MEDEFLPSKLGTLEYWESVYENELENFIDNEDEGEIWFGKSCENRIFEWIKKNKSVDTRIFEFGCGNGHLLVRLAKADFKSLKGLDYSKSAITLSKSYAEAQGIDNISYEEFDLLDERGQFEETADFIIDKGTFDAITLSSEEENEGRSSRVASIATKFKFSLKKALCSASSSTSSVKHFMITSCNWTGEELKRIFSPEFETINEVIHPSFTFGGRQGQTVTTIIFEYKTIE